MKHYVTIQELEKDSFYLGESVLNSGFKPDFMIALWRGGTFIGTCVHELFNWAADKSGTAKVDHIAIRTSKYTGVDVASSEVQVHNLGYLLERLNKNSKVLIVDDIYDTGKSIEAVIAKLNDGLGPNMPSDLRIATVFYKPSRNQTNRIPDYYRHITKEWVVFPHEVEGMELNEIKESKGQEIHAIFERISLS